MHSGTPSLWKPLVAAPFVLFVVISLVLVQPSGRLNNPVLEVRNCDADVQPIATIDIAQSGKARMVGVSGNGINPELVAQKGKARPAVAAESSFVQYARCAQSQV
jgi:hypothetical protein